MYTTHEFVLTHHARKRLQQRGISQVAIQSIIQYGTSHYAGKGCIAYHVDRRALKKALLSGINLHELTNIAVIIASDGAVVTVEHAPKKPKYWKGGRR